MRGIGDDIHNKAVVVEAKDKKMRLILEFGITQLSKYLLHLIWALKLDK